MKLSVVVPAYNESKTILNIISRVTKSIEKLESISDYEILIIDDASRDDTKDVIIKNFEKNNRIKLLFQSKNQGKGAAITRGFSETDGDIVIIQDADLEYDPCDYSILLRPFIEKNADVVYGSRFKGDVVRVLYFWHYIGNTFLTFCSNCFTNLNLSDMETCYKAFRGSVIRSMKLNSKRFGIEPEITAKVAKLDGVRIFEVPISYDGRTYAQYLIDKEEGQRHSL